MDINDDFGHYDALGLADLVRNGETTPSELVETVIDRIERITPILNCVNIKTYEIARARAHEPPAQGLFSGVPYLQKDLVLFYAGVRTTNGCRLYENFVAKDDSVIIERAREAGLILVAKTNTPENGVGITTEPRLFGATRNPWNTERVAGGSSGGSAAAVAARIVPLAHGDDGGGSIRVPASNTGLVGLKPSRGRATYAPHYGDFWYGAAVEGCVSLTVRDTAAYLDVIRGDVPGDPYQPAPPQRPYLEEVLAHPGRLKVGVVTCSPMGNDVDPACVAAVEQTARCCEELGHDVSEMAFSFDAELMWESFWRMAAVAGARGRMAAEAFAKRPATPDDYNRVNWEQAEFGMTVSGVEHAADVETMRQVGRHIARDCQPYDIVLTPTLPVPPREIGFYDLELGRDKFAELLAPDTAFCRPFNISGQPAMSLPMHWTDDGLPVGVQLVARDGDETTIFRLAGQIERARPWIDRKPPITA